MKILAGLGFLLAAASAANAETYTTVVNRDARTVTTTAPNGTTATTTQVSRTSSGATYTTTITRSGGYQPMGSSGYQPMGDYRPMGR
jgi:hypothetical protein